MDSSDQKKDRSDDSRRWDLPVRKILTAVVILLLLISHISTLRTLRRENGLPVNDFVEYWSAARCFAGGSNPYDPGNILNEERRAGWNSARPLMMWNPPWTLPLLLPFSRLSYWTDRGVWYGLNLVLTFVIADWFWRYYGGRRSRRGISWLAVALFFPAGLALYLGQISPMLLAGLAGFLWSVRKNWPWAAGVFLFLLTLKPHVVYLLWIFLLLWVVQTRQWKMLLGLASSLALFSSIVISRNPSIFHQFFQSVSSVSGPLRFQTPTWGEALSSFFPGLGAWIRSLPSVAGIGIGVVLWIRWRNSFSWDRHLPTVLLLSVTTGIFSWTFDWIVLLPVLISILVRIQTNLIHSFRVVCGLALVLIVAFVQPLFIHNYLYYVWLPPALWLLYLAKPRSQNSSPRVTADKLQEWGG